MKAETEALLRQCRNALLQQSDEQIAALLKQWFELMIGEESIDEELDDLCLLLNYRVRSYGETLSYATYTSWWEVECYQEPVEGEFICADVTSLRQRIQAMSIKEFDLILELAFQARSYQAEFNGETRPPTGHELLREMIIWLAYTGTELEHEQMANFARSTSPGESKSQRRKREKQQAELACQQGYLLVDAKLNHWVRDTFRHWCKDHDQPFICIESWGLPFAKLSADFTTLTAQGAGLPTTLVEEHLSTFALRSFTKSQSRPQAHSRPREVQLHWSSKKVIVLDEIFTEDAEEIAQSFLALWPEILKERQLPPAPAKYIPLEPGWKIELKARREQPATATPAPLSETIVLPTEWENSFTREQLQAFLIYLELPAKTRELKATLVERLQERLNADPNARALFFEVFRLELSVPPWELETLLGCTTTERKRWTEDGKLPVLDQKEFRQGRYAVFDRRMILSLSSFDLEQWRAEHQAVVKEHRKAGALAAAATRKARQSD